MHTKFVGKKVEVCLRQDRIAQLIVERICLPELEESETLSKTTRGDKGFGSSGIDDDYCGGITNKGYGQKI